MHMLASGTRTVTFRDQGGQGKETRERIVSDRVCSCNADLQDDEPQWERQVSCLARGSSRPPCNTLPWKGSSRRVTEKSRLSSIMLRAVFLHLSPSVFKYVHIKFRENVFYQKSVYWLHTILYQCKLTFEFHFQWTFLLEYPCMCIICT